MTPAAFSFLKAELGIRNLVNVRVDHCPFAFAAVIDAVAGWRLVYSGDTRPCERLVQVCVCGLLGMLCVSCVSHDHSSREEAYACTNTKEESP